MSKGLEALDNIKDEMLEWTEGYEEDLDIVEKELKALEIIKEKDVNVYWFRYVHKHHKKIETRPFHSNALEAYNSGIKVERRLTQEEYDLLKEVLL